MLGPQCGVCVSVSAVVEVEECSRQLARPEKGHRAHKSSPGPIIHTRVGKMKWCFLLGVLLDARSPPGFVVRATR